MRPRVGRVVHGIRIESVFEVQDTRIVAKMHVLAVGQMARRILPIVATATGTRRHARQIGRAMEPNVLARALRNESNQVHDVGHVRSRIHLELIPLLIFAHLEAADGLARGIGGIDTVIATVRNQALRITNGRESSKNVFARANVTAAAGAAGAAGAWNAAVRRTHFAAVTGLRRLNDLVAAIRKSTIVVATIVRNAIAIVTFFTRLGVGVAIAARLGPSRVTIASTRTRRAAAGAIAAAVATRATLTRTRVVLTIGLARLYAHLRGATRADLR